MHVLLLADAPFAEHERALLERIAAGLTGEGVRVTLAVPKKTAAAFATVSDPVRYSDRGLIFTQRLRAEQVAEAIAGSGKSPEGIVQVVHAFGGGAWTMAGELARLFNAAIAYEVWRGGLVDRVAGLKHPAGSALACFAPDRPVERALAAASAGIPTRLTPWGAYAPPRPTPVLREGKAPSMVFVSSGRDSERCRFAFEGACRVLAEAPDAMLFVAAAAVRRAGLWSIADRAGVLDRVTLIDRLEDRRDLVLRCDIVLYPDANHEQRTLLLDAMAHGLVVVAAADPLVSIIVDEVTAAVPASMTAASWHETILARLADRAGSTALGLSAREHVRQQRRASAHIAALVDAYAWLSGAESLTLPAGG